MEYMDDDLRNRMEQNNQILGEETDAAARQEAQIKNIQESVNRIKETVNPSPVKLAAKALKKMTGKDPSYFISEGVQVIHKRSREHRSLRSIGSRLLGEPTENNKGISLPKTVITIGILIYVYNLLRRK
jgi:hypothetical protein